MGIMVSESVEIESDSQIVAEEQDGELDQESTAVKEPNEVYKNLSQGFTLVFDSTTVFPKPKSIVTTPTSPTRHQRTFSVVTSKNWADTLNSPVIVNEEDQKLRNGYKSGIEVIKEIVLSEKCDNVDNVSQNKNKLTKEKKTEFLQPIVEKIEVSENCIKSESKPLASQPWRKRTNKKDNSNTNGDRSEKELTWGSVAVFLYFHVTAAFGIFLVLSGQVMWQTVAIMLGLHLLSAVGISMDLIKAAIPEMLNIRRNLCFITSFIVPPAISYYYWNENPLVAFLVIAQIGHCLHWYGTWFVKNAEKVRIN